jgi:hypothetical protein
VIGCTEIGGGQNLWASDFFPAQPSTASRASELGGGFRSERLQGDAIVVHHLGDILELRGPMALAVAFGPALMDAFVHLMPARR